VTSQVESLELILGIAGVIGAGLSVAVAILPQVSEWYYERTNRPLAVKVVGTILRVNQTQYGLIRLRVRNRTRSAIWVQVSPMTHGFTPEVGHTEGIFMDPRVLIFPSNEPGGTFWLPGHDSREVALELPARPGIFEGRESVRPVIIANRFVPQHIPVGPFKFVLTHG
jgi:hypothetical protein